MRKRFLATMAALALVAPFAAAAAAALAPVEPERHLVAFHARPALAPGDSYHGARVVEVVPGLKMVVVETRSPAAFHARAALDDAVRYVERDDPRAAVPAHTPNDPLYAHPGQWGVKRIGAGTAWDVTLGSVAVKVASVDTGLNKAHEEFAGQARVLQGYDFADGDNDPDDGSGCAWHGTHTTGIEGATIDNGVGIAGLSQHTILPVKAFGSWLLGCTASTTALVQALTYASDQGAHVVSNPWHGIQSSALSDAIRYAHAKGAILVAPAGNDGPCTNCVAHPWKENWDVVFIVTAMDQRDQFARFSSQGPEVTVIAPGVSILSSTSGTSGYEEKAGTSMAASHVVGSVALYLAANPGAGFAQVRHVLTCTAEDLGLPPDQQGAGLVRVDRMLTFTCG